MIINNGGHRKIVDVRPVRTPVRRAYRPFPTNALVGVLIDPFGDGAVILDYFLPTGHQVNYFFSNSSYYDLTVQYFTLTNQYVVNGLSGGVYFNKYFWGTDYYQEYF